MNKDSLFYIVGKSTNDRVLNNSREPLIVKNEGIVLQKKWYSEDKYDIISIKEYEDTFKDTKCEDTLEGEKCEDTLEGDE